MQNFKNKEIGKRVDKILKTYLQIPFFYEMWNTNVLYIALKGEQLKEIFFV